MINQYNEDEGWKVKILTHIEEPEENADEALTSRIVWSRKKTIKVLLTLIVLVFCVSVGLFIHISAPKKESEDEFIKYVEAGAYSKARNDYINTDEDVEKYCEFIENYFEELIKEYNRTNDTSVYDSILRYEEIYDYRFNLNLDLFYNLYNSKETYKYGVKCYENNDYINAYDSFGYVLENDSNYDSARKYMREIKESFKDDVVNVNIWYTNEKEKVIAEKLEELYIKNNEEEEKLFESRFIYKRVNEEDIKKGMSEGECGIIFTDNVAYDVNGRIYSTSTEILAYNTDYYEALQADSMDTILDMDMDITNIYIPLTDGKFLSGLLSTYNGSIYREEILEGEEWIFSGDYTVDIGNYELEYILNYIKELNNNPKVYKEEDGIEKFANGEIAAAIISSDDYESIKERLGDKLGVTRLPAVSVEGIDLASNKVRIQGINKYSTIKVVYNDAKSNKVIVDFESGIYTNEFARYILEEFGLYNEAYQYLYGTDDKYISIIEQQCMENYNQIDYYDDKIREWMDELAALTRNAASEEDIYNYINSAYWLMN